MGTQIDREIYCELVGIHPRTLSEWVREGIVRPGQVGLHGRQVFTKEDVRFGCGLISLIRQHRGRYTRRELAEVVRGQRELRENASPPGAPDKL